MDDETRKLLAEYLDECWHERGNKIKFNPWKKTGSWECKNCGKYHENRTFTTPDDFFALKDKLVEKGEWDSFHDFVWVRWIDAGYGSTATYINWLINPPRFCNLVGEWLKARDL